MQRQSLYYDEELIYERATCTDSKIWQSFKPTSLIGFGSFGAVVKVVSKTNPSSVFALKVIDTKLGVSEVKEDAAEVYAHQIFNNHPLIIQYYGHQLDHMWGRLFLLLEYAPNSDLLTVVPAEGYNSHECFQIVEQLAEAVAFLHKLGYAHRDIKPENVLIGPDLRIRLCDFGLVFKCVDGNGRLINSNSYAGSDPYIAPEVFNTIEHFPMHADMWAIGILWLTIATALCCWEKPIDGDNHYSSWVDGELDGKPWDNLDVEVVEILKKLINVDPIERFTIEEFRNRLKAMRNEPLIYSREEKQSQDVGFASNTQCCMSDRLCFTQPAVASDFWLLDTDEKPKPSGINFKLSRFFLNTHKAKTALECIQKVLENQRLSVRADSNSKLTVKHRTVQLTVEIFVVDDCCVCDFRRIHGDGLRFQKLFNFIRNGCSNKFPEIYRPPPSAAEMTADFGKVWDPMVEKEIEKWADPPIADPWRSLANKKKDSSGIETNADLPNENFNPANVREDDREEEEEEEIKSSKTPYDSSQKSDESGKSSTSHDAPYPQAHTTFLKSGSSEAKKEPADKALRPAVTIFDKYMLMERLFGGPPESPPHTNNDDSDRKRNRGEIVNDDDDDAANSPKAKK